MKIQFRRLLGLFLALFMVASLTACGNEGTTSTNNPSSSNSPTSDVKEETWNDMLKSLPSNANGRTITVYSWNEKEACTGAVNAIEKFEKDTGVKVNWVTGSYAGYTSEVSALISGKNSPDIVRLKTLDPAIMNLLQPLSVSGYDFSGDIWDTKVKDYYTVNGQTFGVSVKNSLLQQPAVLYYNKSLVSQFDLEDPYALWKKGKWTWDSFTDYCKVFKEEAGEDYMAWSPRNGADLLESSGLSFAIFDGSQYVSKMNDEKLISTLKETCNIYKSGITTGSFWNQAGFNSGKTLFFTDSIIGARKTHFYYSEMKSMGKLGIVPMPLNDDDTPRYQVFSECEAYAIPKGAKNSDLVPYFLRCYLDPEHYDSKNFFADQTMLDVFNWCIEQPNRFIGGVDGSIITADVGIVRDELMKTIVGKSADQVESVLKTYAAQVENAVKQSNKKLESVG